MKGLSLSIRIKARILPVTYRAFRDLATPLLLSHILFLSAPVPLASPLFPVHSRHTPLSGLCFPSFLFTPLVDAFRRPPFSGVLIEGLPENTI